MIGIAALAGESTPGYLRRANWLERVLLIAGGTHAGLFLLDI